MQQQKNQSVVETIFKELKTIIKHRTTEKSAVNILTQVINELSASYGFLQYITINQTMYVEQNDVDVDSRISSVDENQLSNALESVIKKVVVEMKEGADYFFIKEIQDALENINKVHSFIKEFTPLEAMQQDFLSQRKLSTAIPKTQLLIDVIHAILATVNKYHPEKESVHVLRSCFIEMEKKFNFINLIVIAQNTENIGYYTVEMNTSIQHIPTYQLSEAICHLSNLIGKKIHIDNRDTFREQFKQNLGRENVRLLRDINVPVDTIEFSSRLFKMNDILQRLIESLLRIINQYTSERFAIVVMKKLIIELKEQNEIFTSIQMEEKNGSFQIDFLKDMESFHEESVRKAMKALIQAVGMHLKRKQAAFTYELKKLLGEEYVSTIEELGINFHIFELKFD